MVEPLDAQNMLSRTPMVEKTVAAQNEQAALHHAQAEQFRRESLHKGEQVTGQRKSEKTEDRLKKQGDPSQAHEAAQEQGQPSIEWVEESDDDSQHELDVTV